MFKPGNRVHVSTKDHRTADNVEVVSDDGKVLVVRIEEGLHKKFIEDIRLPWSEIMYCYEQAQWDLECEIAKGYEGVQEEDDD